MCSMSCVSYRVQPWAARHSHPLTGAIRRYGDTRLAGCLDDIRWLVNPSAIASVLRGPCGGGVPLLMGGLGGAYRARLKLAELLRRSSAPLTWLPLSDV